MTLYASLRFGDTENQLYVSLTKYSRLWGTVSVLGSSSYSKLQRVTDTTDEDELLQTTLLLQHFMDSVVDPSHD